ncbi:MAG: hypothetical protein H0W72_16865, partial [Planctomycetes bacterium]|nr:hypothetical protein [Planctomycetota bacterium]
MRPIPITVSVAMFAAIALAYAACALVRIEAADQRAHGRLAGLDRERGDGAAQWPWRATDPALLERQFARRLGLLDADGAVMVELLPDPARDAIAQERAAAIAENDLHALVRWHGRRLAPLSAIAAMAFLSLAWLRRADPRRCPQAAAVVAAIAAVGIAGRALTLDLSS